MTSPPTTPLRDAPRPGPHPREKRLGPAFHGRTQLLLAAFLLGLVLLLTQAVHGQGSPRKEDEQTLKAAYLLSFPTYITWPTNKSLQEGVVVGLMGEDAKLAAALADAVKQKTATSATHRFVRAREIAQAAECHVLFVARSEIRRLADILDALKDKPILTVADADGFTHAGGGIRLFLDGARLRMEINQANIEASGLKASTRLLRLGIAGTAGPTKN